MGQCLLQAQTWSCSSIRLSRCKHGNGWPQANNATVRQQTDYCCKASRIEVSLEMTKLMHLFAETGLRYSHNRFLKWVGLQHMYIPRSELSQVWFSLITKIMLMVMVFCSRSWQLCNYTVRLAYNYMVTFRLPHIIDFCATRYTHWSLINHEAYYNCHASTYTRTDIQ